MAHRQKLPGGTAGRIGICLLLILFLLGAATVSVFAWISRETVNAENRLIAADQIRGLELWMYPAVPMEKMEEAADLPPQTGGEKPLLQPDWDSARLLDAGDVRNEPEERSLPQSGNFFSAEDWLPGQRIARFLAIRNYDGNARDFQITFRCPPGGFLAEAVSVSAYPWPGNPETARREIPYFRELGLEELAGHPLDCSVAAAPADSAGLSGQAAYTEQLIRLDFAFAATASDLYRSQAVSLEVNILAGQPATGGGTLLIHSMEELRTALSIVEQPDGSFQYREEYDPDNPAYIGAEDAARDPQASRRARLGDTLYLVDSFDLEGTVELRKQVNLYFAGTLRFSQENQSRFRISIPPERANSGPMDIGSAVDSGGMRFDGLSPESCLAISAPDSVQINWYRSVCVLPDSVWASKGSGVCLLP